jgi:hypothetical protein
VLARPLCSNRAATQKEACEAYCWRLLRSLLKRHCSRRVSGALPAFTAIYDPCMRNLERFATQLVHVSLCAV